MVWTSCTERWRLGSLSLPPVLDGQRFASRLEIQTKPIIFSRPYAFAPPCQQPQRVFTSKDLLILVNEDSAAFLTDESPLFPLADAAGIFLFPLLFSPHLTPHSHPSTFNYPLDMIQPFKTCLRCTSTPPLDCAAYDEAVTPPGVLDKPEVEDDLGPILTSSVF